MSCTLSEIIGLQPAQNAEEANFADSQTVVLSVIFCEPEV
jgi:hypothetical protein